MTKSISGHLTDQMREHYSTVTAGEQRESIGRLLNTKRESTNDDASHGGAPTRAGGAPAT